MKALAIFIGVTTLVALVGGATYLFIRTSDQTSGELRDVRAELSRLKRVGAARDPAPPTNLGSPGEAIRTRGAASEPEPAASVAPAQDATTPPTPEMSDEEREYRFGVEQAARLESYENAFSREKADAQWSATARAMLEQKYSGEQFSALRLSVDCRATLCRVAFTFSDVQAAREAAARLHSSPPWDGRAYATMDTDRKVGVNFVAREGHSLPPVDQASVKY